VKHIIVCGHYRCGSVLTALRGSWLGLIDNWLRHVQDVRQKHDSTLSVISDESQRSDKLCELNVFEQVVNVCQTTVVQDAWARGHEVAVHGWIYGIHDGLLQDLNIVVTGTAEILPAYRAAIAGLINKQS
jgi:carbonic anhydrase